jgi:hypothetical protein
MPDKGSNRRSNAVGLTILGLVATVGIADKAIPQPTEMRRNLYANRVDCERDYPPPPNRCDQDNGGSNTTGGGHGGSFHGPYYSANRSTVPAGDPGPGRMGATAVAHETSYRGGFGAIGRTIHAVG